ncbi:hypothetical protein [Parachlamydia acanthamoebae]|uniref:hypothetical protein n=1 Tax=Parachlamydia acanthamoebae TaxID=83552 RepID=UPI0002F6A5DA|nr:hypothetical protein [Parachlamydia acanthamoebae]
MTIHSATSAMTSEFLFKCFMQSDSYSTPLAPRIQSPHSKMTSEILEKYRKKDIRSLARTFNLKAEEWLSYFKGVSLILDRPILEMGLHLVRHFSQNNIFQALQILRYLFLCTTHANDELLLAFINLSNRAENHPLFKNKENLELRYSIFIDLLTNLPNRKPTEVALFQTLVALVKDLSSQQKFDECLHIFGEEQKIKLLKNNRKDLHRYNQNILFINCLKNMTLREAKSHEMSVLRKTRTTLIPEIVNPALWTFLEWLLEQFPKEALFTLHYIAKNYDGDKSLFIPFFCKLSNSTQNLFAEKKYTKCRYEISLELLTTNLKEPASELLNQTIDTLLKDLDTHAMGQEYRKLYSQLRNCGLLSDAPVTSAQNHNSICSEIEIFIEKKKFSEAIQLWQQLLESSISPQEIELAAKYLEVFLKKDHLISSVLASPRTSSFAKVCHLSANHLLETKLPTKELQSLLKLLAITPLRKFFRWNVLYQNVSQNQQLDFFLNFLENTHTFDFLSFPQMQPHLLNIFLAAIQHNHLDLVEYLLSHAQILIEQYQIRSRKKFEIELENILMNLMHKLDSSTSPHKIRAITSLLDFYKTLRNFSKKSTQKIKDRSIQLCIKYEIFEHYDLCFRLLKSFFKHTQPIAPIHSSLRQLLKSLSEADDAVYETKLDPQSITTFAYVAITFKQTWKCSPTPDYILFAHIFYRIYKLKPKELFEIKILDLSFSLLITAFKESSNKQRALELVNTNLVKDIFLLCIETDSPGLLFSVNKYISFLKLFLPESVYEDLHQKFFIKVFHDTSIPKRDYPIFLESFILYQSKASKLNDIFEGKAIELWRTAFCYSLLTLEHLNDISYFNRLWQLFKNQTMGTEIEKSVFRLEIIKDSLLEKKHSRKKIFESQYLLILSQMRAYETHQSPDLANYLAAALTNFVFLFPVWDEQLFTQYAEKIIDMLTTASTNGIFAKKKLHCRSLLSYLTLHFESYEYKRLCDFVVMQTSDDLDAQVRCRLFYLLFHNDTLIQDNLRELLNRFFHILDNLVNIDEFFAVKPIECVIITQFLCSLDLINTDKLFKNQEILLKFGDLFLNKILLIPPPFNRYRLICFWTELMKFYVDNHLYEKDPIILLDNIARLCMVPKCETPPNLTPIIPILDLLEHFEKTASKCPAENFDTILKDIKTALMNAIQKYDDATNPKENNLRMKACIVKQNPILSLLDHIEIYETSSVLFEEEGSLLFSLQPHD